MPQAVRSLTKSAKPVIGPQRIASGRDEIDQPVDRLPFQRLIGRGPANLVEHNVRIERRGTGAGHDMLRQHIERAWTEPVAIKIASFDRIQRGARLRSEEHTSELQSLMLSQYACFF